MQNSGETECRNTSSGDYRHRSAQHLTLLSSFSWHALYLRLVDIIQLIPKRYCNICRAYGNTMVDLAQLQYHDAIASTQKTILLHSSKRSDRTGPLFQSANT